MYPLLLITMGNDIK